MPPPTPLPVATKLLGLFVRGFWRRLAEWLPWWRPSKQTSDPVEEFLRGIFEVIAKVEGQVRNGTYQPPEEKPRPPRKRDKKPPDKPPEPSGRHRPPIPVRTGTTGPPPAAPPADAEPAPRAPNRRPSRPPRHKRASPPSPHTEARPPPRAPRVRDPPKKARTEPKPRRALIITIS